MSRNSASRRKTLLLRAAHALADEARAAFDAWAVKPDKIAY